MNAGIEGHSIMYPDLPYVSNFAPGGLLTPYFVHTSTSSPSSQTNSGPGNWPFMWIISRGCPFGLPTSHVNVKLCFTYLEHEVAASARIQRSKQQGAGCIVHKRLMVLDFQKRC